MPNESSPSEVDVQPVQNLLNEAGDKFEEITEKVGGGGEVEEMTEEVGCALIKKEFLIRRQKRNKNTKSASVDGAENGADAIENGADAVKNGADAVKNGADAIGNGADSIGNGADSIGNVAKDSPTDGNSIPVSGGGGVVGAPQSDKESGQKRKAGSEEASTKKMKGQFKNRPVDKRSRDPTLKLCNRFEYTSREMLEGCVNVET